MTNMKKRIAYNKINMKKTKKKNCFGRSRNIVGKGENKFSPFPTMFSKALFFRVVKMFGLCDKELKKIVTEWLVGWLVVLGFNAT